VRCARQLQQWSGAEGHPALSESRCDVDSMASQECYGMSVVNSCRQGVAVWGVQLQVPVDLTLQVLSK